MSEKLWVNVGGGGLCHACDCQKREVERPDNWDSMDDDEKHEYMRECFFDTFEWGWGEGEIND